jgi:hypothetical protein
MRHLFVSDEEFGSHTSREIIEREAKRARYGSILACKPITLRQSHRVQRRRRHGIAVESRTDPL